MSDLREGLARAFRLRIEAAGRNSATYHLADVCADAAIAYLRQHDGHAELRERLRVAEGALDDGRDYVGSALTCYNRDGALCQLCLDRLELFSLGDAELAKEKP